MVEVNAKGKSKGCSVGACIGYFVYFSILVAVAVVGEFQAHLVVWFRQQRIDDGCAWVIPRCIFTVGVWCLVFAKNCSMKVYRSFQIRKIRPWYSI